LGKVRGIIGTGRYAVYANWPSHQHQFFGARLKRLFTKFSERGGEVGDELQAEQQRLLAFVTSASIQDRDAALPLLNRAKIDFPSLQVTFMDGAYRGEIKNRIETDTSLRVEISLRSDTKKNGFEPLPVHWIVERTFGWMNRYRLFFRRSSSELPFQVNAI
jgi:hypothetical protein